MCGIAGIVSNNIVSNLDKIIIQMTDTMKHRGPDDQGVWCNGNVGLGHRRLSIIDLSGGHQPMHDEESGMSIVFNGEIYNYQSIKNELISQGERFLTSSDTEVILKAYKLYGKKCVDKFNGMFAFAIWDEKKQILFLARDRLGVKPLYYSLIDGVLYFSSEFNPIVKMIKSKSINTDAFIDYMNYLYIPTPKTIYNEISKFPASHVAEWRNGKLEMWEYWTPWNIIPTTNITEQEYLEELDYIFMDSVKLRMISDVPLGAFLSGGIDSSTVVSAMSRLSSAPIKTFTIGFENDPNSEVNDAKKISRYFKTDHNEKIITPVDIPTIVNEIVSHFGEPFADSSAVPTFLVSKMAREHVTVALSGDGGDELFSGYNAYLYYTKLYSLKKKLGSLTTLSANIFDMLPANVSSRFKNLQKMKSFFTKYKYDIGQQWSISRSILSRGAAATVLNRDYYADFVNKKWNMHVSNYFKKLDNLDIIDRLCRVDMQTYLPDDLLVKVDRMSMAASLEVRSPFLDYRLTELSMRIPQAFKLNRKEGKLILKKYLSLTLDKSIMQKKKQGFTMPLNRWFKNELLSYVKDLLYHGSAIKLFFDRKSIENIIDEHQKGRADHDGLLWALLIFESWYAQSITE